MANFNLNNFIESAMKVEAGELKTLRKPVVKIRECDALSFSKLRDSSGSDIYYVDDRLSKRTG
uniref:Aspartate aminotransferase family protein n=1 Tax=Angiostrongylus cantonensis TaxID=6313 RepID=A0A0K0D770_ANGCA